MTEFQITADQREARPGMAHEQEETFECRRCKAAGLPPEEYTRPISELVESEDGEQICEACADNDRDDDDDWYDWYDDDGWYDDDDWYDD
jgi:hypothetical protein